MLKRLMRHLTYANVVASLALFIALGGAAYAAATITGAEVVDESLTGADVKGRAASSGVAAVDGTLTGEDLKDGSVKTADIAASAVSNTKLSSTAVTGAKVADGSLGGADVADGSLSGWDVADGTIGGADVAYGSIDGSAIADGSVGKYDLAPTEKWHYIGDPGEPAFQNGWSNYDPAASHFSSVWQHTAFAKDALGVVHLRGLVKGGAVGQPMFTLPANYCPWYYHAFGVIANDAFARLTVSYDQGGGCLVYVSTGSNTWVSLEGVDYQDYTLESRSSAPARADAPVERRARPLP